MQLGELSLSLSQIMKVLLRNEVTGSYVGRETAWAKNVEGAAETLHLQVRRRSAARSRRARRSYWERVRPVSRVEVRLR